MIRFVRTVTGSWAIRSPRPLQQNEQVEVSKMNGKVSLVKVGQQLVKGPNFFVYNFETLSY